MKKIVLFILAVLICFSNFSFGQFPGGTYYIGNPGTRPPSGDPDFTTLKAACDTLNSAGSLGGNCTFYITSDLTEAVNVGLGVNTNGYSITFKPSADANRTITFQQTTDNAGPSGAFVIGTKSLADWLNLITTDNIIVDGYATSGSTRRLIFTTTSTSHAGTYPITIVGNTNYITVQNCKISHNSTSGTSAYGINIRVRNDGANNFVPDFITIDNCEITATAGGAGQSIGFTNSGTPSEWPTNIIIKNNILTARTRGIFLNYAGDTNIFNNEIKISQTNTGVWSFGIYGNLIGKTTNITNIYNNKFTTLSTANRNWGTFGIVGIYAGSRGIYNIYNNTLSGFAATNNNTTYPNPSCLIDGIWIQGTDVTANVYFNSINMTNLSITGAGNLRVLYRGINFVSGTTTIKNNIIINNENDFSQADTVRSFNIYRAGATGSFTSDYNCLYKVGANGKIGYWNTAGSDDLSLWQSASLKDANSKSVNVTFTSATDLHLAGGSIGDVNLKGTPIIGYTKDIDNQDRDATFPYMGADENLDSPLPIELAALSYKLQNGFINLSWTTATEVNSYKFEVERSADKSAWAKIGEVSASGNSNSNKEYSFTDNQPASGKYFYRLKMVDNDGSFAYSKEIEVENLQPKDFSLSQNYPNPFNPTTTITYQLPVDANVKLMLFTITGELVRELVNSNQSAGNYNVTLDASGLASGTYIYRLIAGDFVSTKKLVILK